MTVFGPGAWIAIAIGGVIGTWSRFALGGWLAARATVAGAPGLWATPAGTLAINVAGSAVLGAVVAVAVAKPGLMPTEVRLALAVGFCGAFTTFSTFGVETLAMLQAGRWDWALGYVAASNLLGIGAAAGGWALARALAG